MDVARAASIFLPFVLSNRIVPNSTVRIRPYQRYSCIPHHPRIYFGHGGVFLRKCPLWEQVSFRFHLIERGRIRPRFLALPGGLLAGFVSRRNASSIRSFFELLQNLPEDRLISI